MSAPFSRNPKRLQRPVPLNEAEIAARELILSAGYDDLS